jgi:hypothetical protein
MAGPGVVGMAMGNHGALDWPHRIDMEAARLAAQAGRLGCQDVLRAHVVYIGRKAIQYQVSCAGLTRASIFRKNPFIDGLRA